MWRTRKPEREGVYLVFTLRGLELGLWEDGLWFNKEGSERMGVSHWMPLPEPPA